MACPTPADLLRARTEDLTDTLYLRASYKSPWLGAIPRGEYPQNSGYVRSTFTIGRSEPTSDEETWEEIKAINAETNAGGACGTTYNSVEVGELETTAKPSKFGLKGPLECIDNLMMNWKSTEFWDRYIRALDKRSSRSIENKLINTYMQYVPKASCNDTFTWHDGDITTQPFTGTVDMTDLDADLPTSLLLQQFLDDTARVLNEEGANDESNSDGWITLGDAGPEYPLIIGQEASNYILLNNSELRKDYNASFQGAQDINPVIKRMGASRVIKNFRHLITLFPPRWKLDQGALTRVPTFVMSSAAGKATKGKVADVNPDWRNPAVAEYEAAVVLSTMVMREDVLRPASVPAGMKFNPQNYYGDWTFVTGNDAVLGMDDCAGIADPMHKQGRHFCEYRHALNPIFPTFGRVILFKRCPAAFDTVTCS